MNKPIVSLKQWHPPFANAMRITLLKDEHNMDIQAEYGIQALPSRMDMCITLHDPRIPMHKSIGNIFRKYNLVEYKPQGESLTWDDYCYMLGNAFLMKSRGMKRPVDLEDISITLVGYHFPRKLFRQLKSRRRSVRKQEPGMYYIEGEDFATQIIVLNRLDPEEYLWLTSLHRGLSVQKQDRLIKEYQSHSQDKLYRDVMNFIVTINREDFARRKEMCDALMEILRPQIEERLEQGIRQGVQQGIQQGMQRGMQQGMQQSILDILAAHGEVPADVRKTISDETMLETLRDWLRKAVRTDSVEEFVSQIS